MNKKEVKVYRVNKKLLKRIIIGIIIIVLITFIAFPLTNFVKNMYYSSLVEYKFDKYNFSIKVPRAYEDLTVGENEDYFTLNESAFKTETGIDVDEKYVSKKPTTIFRAGNILNGIYMALSVLETEKISLTLDEIATNYQATIMANYDDKYTIGNLETEYLTILNGEAIKVKIEMYDKKVSNTFVTYLAPLEDKEVTITFYGKTTEINKNLDEIENIISTIK